jgi:hypothetical protein
MARRGKARNKGKPGRNEATLALLLVRTHTKRRMVQRICAKVIVCCAVHMHEGSMQPGGILIVLIDALEQTTGELLY